MNEIENQNVCLEEVANSWK